jgi:hypothetical protein
MGIRWDMRWAAVLLTAAVAVSAAAAAPAHPADADGGSVQATEAGKKKCKRKPGEKLTKKQRKRCRVKKKPATLTATCPTAPVIDGGGVVITGTLSPDAKGNSPLGAIWESSTASPSDGNLSFFTSPGGSYSFSFVSANPTTVPVTTTVRVDFAGDTLFADRRQASAQCQFTTLP